MKLLRITVLLRLTVPLYFCCSCVFVHGRNTHNNLRITRILKCLGTLGFPHYQAPLVRFFLEQTLVKGKLYNVKESALNYFIFAVIDKQERRNLVKYAYAHYEPKHEFVWCPKTIQSIFRGETFPDEKPN